MNAVRWRPSRTCRAPPRRHSPELKLIPGRYGPSTAVAGPVAPGRGGREPWCARASAAPNVASWPAWRVARAPCASDSIRMGGLRSPWGAALPARPGLARAAFLLPSTPRPAAGGLTPGHLLRLCDRPGRSELEQGVQAERDEARERDQQLVGGRPVDQQLGLLAGGPGIGLLVVYAHGTSMPIESLCMEIIIQAVSDVKPF